MDGNKDEALRCVKIAEEAVASGNRDRALKFIKMAQRLNHNLSVSELLAACEKLDSASCTLPSGSVNKKCMVDNDSSLQNGRIHFNERSYSEEHMNLIWEIRKNKDYYAILGVEKSCSVEEIRKAYKKLSLKIHPDKNKAPGSEEAFKKLSKAFKCLSESDSRRQYDQTGLIDEFEENQLYNNVRRRRRRTNVHEFYEEDFDPDEIFRAFFGQADMFGTRHVYTSRAAASQRREEVHGGGGGGPNLFLLLQILLFLIIFILAFSFILAYLPFSEPEYSLMKNYPHQIPKSTEKHGVGFFVKTIAFDDKFPLGSPARASIEDNVMKDYRNLLWRYCHVELQRRHWNRNLPTPNCDNLHGLGLA